MSASASFEPRIFTGQGRPESEQLTPIGPVPPPVLDQDRLGESLCAQAVHAICRPCPYARELESMSLRRWVRASCDARALSDELQQRLKAKGFEPVRVEMDW